MSNWQSGYSSEDCDDRSQAVSWWVETENSAKTGRDRGKSWGSNTFVPRAGAHRGCAAVAPTTGPPSLLLLSERDKEQKS